MLFNCGARHTISKVSRLSQVRSSQIPLLLILLSQSACSHLDRYDITLNERTLYSPRSLFEDYYLPDAALADCVSQAIEDAEIVTADGLEALNCSKAGIQSLGGLARFSELKRLKVNDNNIRNLVELTKLDALLEIQIDNNAIVDVVPLTALPDLQTVSLTGNAALQCHSLSQFANRVTVIKPEHC